LTAGVFGNLSDADVKHTIRPLPHLALPIPPLLLELLPDSWKTAASPLHAAGGRQRDRLRSTKTPAPWDRGAVSECSAPTPSSRSPPDSSSSITATP